MRTGTEEAVRTHDESADTLGKEAHQRLGGGESVETSAADLSFIETQFPVSKLSKESYKERKANYSQTLTGLGKWWGRKPLIMVRAVILGLLMPASTDPRRDRDVFLALLTMDKEGLWRRKSRNIPLKEVYRRLSSHERKEWFAAGTNPERPKLRKGTTTEEKERLQRTVFDRMGYDEKLSWCDRPEQVDGPSPEAWRAINEHLGTESTNLPDLIRELGEQRFGRVPRVGDAFCGGGSVPFEAARIGCEAYGSDLNPVAALLTWGALNIIGGGEESAESVRQGQTEVFDAVDRQITEWQIEHNDVGWRADAYLYCTETKCPECGWRVPLAPSWVIGEKTRTVAQLTARASEQRFDISIRSGVDSDTLLASRKTGTVKESRVECPNRGCGASTPMNSIRGDQRGRNGQGNRLRLWNNDDFVPRPNDVFQERIYCIRWRLPRLDELLEAEQRGRSPKQVPDWIDLDHAIRALSEWLDADEQRALNELRKQNWVAEERAFEDARRELHTLKERESPRKCINATAKRLKQIKERIRERHIRVESLAKVVPSVVSLTN